MFWHSMAEIGIMATGIVAFFALGLASLIGIIYGFLVGPWWWVPVALVGMIGSVMVYGCAALLADQLMRSQFMNL